MSDIPAGDDRRTKLTRVSIEKQTDSVITEDLAFDLKEILTSMLSSLRKIETHLSIISDEQLKWEKEED